MALVMIIFPQSGDFTNAVTPVFNPQPAVNIPPAIIDTITPDVYELIEIADIIILQTYKATVPL